MRKWWPLVAVCAGAFMLLVDVTIVNVALPEMARQLHTTFSDLQWVIDLYALALGALVLTVGSVADRLGRRRVYLAGLVLFAASSLACGVAPDVGVLIAARGVQGAGAAAMFATTMALISNTYSGRDRGVAFGAWGAVNGGAAAVGPVLGGLLTASVSWRLIFLVNLPVSVIAVVLTLRVVAESRDPQPQRQHRTDLPGMVSFTVAAAALTYALIRGAWASGETITLIVVAAAALAAFAAAERRSAAPMLELRLLRNPVFTAMLLAGGLLSAAAWAGLTYESLWLQSVLGLSPVKAGLVMLPCAGAAFLVSGQVGRFLHRASPRVMVGAGLLLIAAGAFAQAVVRQNSSWPVVIPGLVLVGVGAGLAIASLTSTAMAAVPGQRAGMAGGALSASRQLGYAFGIAVLGELFRAGLTRTGGSSLSAALSGGQAQAVLARTPALAPRVHQAFAAGLDLAWLVAGGLGLAGAAAVFVLARPRPPASPAAGAQDRPAAAVSRAASSAAEGARAQEGAAAPAL
jgi:EmrB/QacA subfamily drug resistance transporter